MKQETFNAYVAGLFDGEGSCVVRKRRDKRYKKGYQVLIKVTLHNKNKKVLEKIQSNFGGHIYFHKRDRIWYLKISRVPGPRNWG